MREEFSRSELLFGSRAMEKLDKSRVAVFGVGGVGGYVVEALARSGVGAIDLIDGDVVAPSNINRQIIATVNTVGRAKTEVAAERVLSINPYCNVTEHRLFFTQTTQDMLDFSLYNYVVDAVDMVSGKLAIIGRARAAGVPVISCMGAGNKLHPEMFEVADISETSVCPLARVMRRELKKRGITELKVVYSKEEPIKAESESGVRPVTGSNAFTPSVAGLIMAGEVIRELIKE